MTEDIRLTIGLMVIIPAMWGMLKLAVKVAAKEAVSDQKVVWKLKQGYIDY